MAPQKVSSFCLGCFQKARKWERQKTWCALDLPWDAYLLEVVLKERLCLQAVQPACASPGKQTACASVHGQSTLWERCLASAADQPQGASRPDCLQTAIQRWIDVDLLENEVLGRGNEEQKHRKSEAPQDSSSWVVQKLGLHVSAAGLEPCCRQAGLPCSMRSKQALWDFWQTVVWLELVLPNDLVAS